MTKAKRVTQSIRAYVPDVGMKITMPSCTEPDQSYTVKEILQKFRAGVAPDIGKNPKYYDGDLDSLDLEKLRHADPFEKEQFSRQLSQAMLETEKRLQDLATEKELEEEELKKQEQQFKDWKKIQSEKKEQNATKTPPKEEASGSE